ncbi:HTH-type transcriptional regulator YjdC [Photobacterium malacitanum]|uniref:HTH-type transcriptional regulator YjdC n=1 Tax=Photobacterium malacitanum TaxID=2204294 RepID=A0A1Y6M7Y0_9GAMM|nr:TetR/AcrR family transcriptional regulator [Photobacterium malacitanum]SMY31860.1 HTH-type transcriptional regulator YjdC [Photobacterium malacitanum]
MSKQQEKRLNIINKTINLCAQYGFHGTSMDSITTATGVSKATIYKYFTSKENLINEALVMFSERALNHLSIIFSDPSLTLEQKLSERFEVLVKLMKDDLFNGCYFQLAYSEFNHTDNAIADTCSGYKMQRVEMIQALLTQHNITNAALKSQQAELIFNGLLASLQITKNTQLISMAKDMYLDIIFKD